MNILGISAFYHDSAAALLIDGKLAAAAQEERFTRKKHDASYPKHAIQFCLSKLASSQKVDYVAFYDNFALKHERALNNALSFYPQSIEGFADSVGNWEKYQELLTNLRETFSWSKPEAFKKTFFSMHHLSHAASAYYCSGFDEAATLTIDGVGEYSTTTIGKAKGNKIQLIRSIDFPNSLGLFYSAFTHFLGFKVNSGEYKVMGLAPLGSPVYREKILSNIIKLKNDGSFELNMEYFRFHVSSKMIDRGKMEELFGFSARASEEALDQRHKDLAASVQLVIEEAVFGLAKAASGIISSHKLCVAGGVGLNCSAFGKLRNMGIFKNIYVQPAAGDAGGAFGAALILHELKNDANGKIEPQFNVYAGPNIDAQKAKSFFIGKGYPFIEMEGGGELTDFVAKKLAEGSYVGWCNGKMEWGPRALGNRSILASPLKPGVHKDLNLHVKKREDFRPFAPVVREESMKELFINCDASPYMTFVFFLKEALRSPESEFNGNGIRLGAAEMRALKESVIHKDWSARVQTINYNQNPLYYSVLDKYYNMTGCPMLVNTSFNVRGEPIVCTYQEAYKCFIRANLDILVVNNLVLERKNQPVMPQSELEVFEPD